jgi:prefoldin subunit 5
MDVELETSSLDIANLESAAVALDVAISETASDVSTLQSQMAATLLNVDSLEDDVTSLENTVSDLSSDSGEHSTTLTVLQSDLGTLDAQVANLAADIAGIDSTVNEIDAAIDALGTDTASIEAKVSANESNISALESDLEDAQADVSDLLWDVSLVQRWAETVEELDEYLYVDSDSDAVYFVGANVYIQSGSGITDDDGDPTGVGNLIVGYDEDARELDASASASDKSGSHNLVVGAGHSYPQIGGLVAGYINALSDDYEVVY